MNIDAPASNVKNRRAKASDSILEIDVDSPASNVKNQRTKAKQPQKSQLLLVINARPKRKIQKPQCYQALSTMHQLAKGASKTVEIKDLLYYAFTASAEIASSTSETTPATEPDPLTYKAAMASKNKDQWIKAMREEWEALETMNTFEHVKELPNGRKAIKCRWVYKRKSLPKLRYKARLVIKGFMQLYGIDYQETFAPVAKIATIRLLLSCIVNGYKLHQLDVQTAFLNPDLNDNECVYMELPDGFVNQMTKYLRLWKSLYGLKQAPRAWYKEIDHYLTSIGFKASAYDPNLYLHKDGHTMLVLYVDDLLIAVAPKHRASTSSVTPDQIQSTIKKLVELLSGKYKMVDLGRPTSFLGIQIEISDNCVKILQTQYIEEVLKRFGMNDAARVSTPMVPNSKLSKS